MAWIKIIEGTVCGGSPVPEGAVVEAGEADARQLIAMGRAVRVAAPAPPVKPTDEPPLEDAPLITRRGKRR